MKRLVLYLLFAFSFELQAQTKGCDGVSDGFPGAGRDIYCGYTAISGTATGYWHTQKISNEWWLVDPLGYGNRFIAPFNVGPDRPTVVAKFSTTTDDYPCVYLPSVVHRMRLWNYTSLGGGSDAYLSPVPAITRSCWPVDSDLGGRYMPLEYRMPMVMYVQTSDNANTNRTWNHTATALTQPVKAFNYGLNPSVGYGGYLTAAAQLSEADFYDPALYTYFDYAMTNIEVLAWYWAAPLTLQKYVVGLLHDEGDAVFSFTTGGDNTAILTGKEHIHGGVRVLRSSPVQVANLSNYALYPDHKVYTKATGLRVYLAGKYANIAALNTAWGSTYSACDLEGTGNDFGSCGTQITGEAFATADGGTSTYTHTLSQLTPSWRTVALYVDGSMVAGDIGYNTIDTPTYPAPSQFYGPLIDNTVSTINYSTGSCAITFRAASVEIISVSGNGVTVTVKTGSNSRGAPKQHGAWVGAHVTISGTTNYNMTGAVVASIVDSYTFTITSAATGPSETSGTASFTDTSPPKGAAITVSYIKNGWGIGNGVMDEDGRHTVWLGDPNDQTNGIQMNLATAGVRTDLEAFLGQMAAQYFSHISSVFDSHMGTGVSRKMLNLGTDPLANWGSMPHAGVLQAAGLYTDVLNIVSYRQGYMMNQAKVDWIRANAGDKPLINQDFIQANPDSALRAYAGEQDVAHYNTQVERGLGYISIINGIRNLAYTAGGKPYVGTQFWQWLDPNSEQTNWGILTRLDNNYDGVESVTATVTCAAPDQAYNCGGETYNSGNFVSSLAVANALWQPAAGGQSLILTGTDPNWTTGISTIPSGAPYNALTSMRWDGRVHNFTPPTGAYAVIASYPGLDILLYSNRYLRISNSIDTLSLQPAIDTTGRTDFVFRAQRNLTTNEFTLEVWNVDGTSYAISTATITTAGTPSWAGGTFRIGYGLGFGATFDLAYFRWYSGTTALNGQPPTNAFGGTLGDWEFQGNGNDQNGLMNLTFNSSSYAATPQYNPVVRTTFPHATSTITQPALRAGIANTLDLSTSYSLGPDSALTYSCTQLSGPTTITWTGQGTNQCSMDAGVTFGQYNVRIQVTDSAGNSSHTDYAIGVVNMDANGVVTSSDANIDQIIGPMLGYGWDPWPYLDERHKTLIDGYTAWIPSLWSAIDTAVDGGAGVSISNGSTALTGVGTHFQAITGCAPNCSPAVVLMVIWYPVGAGYGRTHLFIDSCSSDTSCTATYAYGGPTVAGAQYSMISTVSNTVGYNYWYSPGGTYHWDGYDVVLATYALYYRTGLTVYKTAADDMAQHWFRAPHTDEGRCWTYGTCLVDRARSWWGLILAAYLNVPNITWSRIYDLINGEQSTLTAAGIIPEVREVSYSVITTALASKYGTAPPAVYRTNLSTVVNRYAQSVCPTTNRPGCQDGALPYELGAWSTWNNNGGAATVTVGSNLVQFEPGKIDACLTGGWCAAPHLYFRFSDLGSSGSSYNDADYYTLVSIPDSTHIQMDRAYAGTCPGGAQQCQKDWSNNQWIGWGTQGWVQGFAATAMWYASQAIAVSDPPTSTVALGLLHDTANWIVNYGIQTDIRGLYECRMFPTAEPPESAIALLVGCSSSTTDWTAISAAWFTAGEVVRGIAAAYQQNPTVALKNAGDLLVGTALGRYGGPSNYLGCAEPAGRCWNSELDFLLPLPSSYKPKDVGFWLGVGGAYTWGAARLGIPAPTPPPITFTLSGTARITGTVSAK